MQLIREKDLAKVLDISQAKLRRDRFENRGLTFYRLGRTIRYDLDQVIKSLEEKPIRK